MTACTSQVHLDETRTRTCLTASLAAYNDFAELPIASPRGWRMVHRFTGWDQLLYRSGEIERFGLIFQSKSDPEQFLVAFRGTDSLMDAYEDAWFDTTAFVACDAPDFPKGVEVAVGFYDVYDRKAPGMAMSMREQVFAFLDKATPKSVIVTGHSLGAALANLFTLDYAASRGHVALTSTTFASPRSGTAAWAKAYDQTYALKDRTFRVANWFDWVPTLPPNTILGYEHVGQPFLVAFWLEHSLETDILSRHSLLNYQTTLLNALPLEPQAWKGTFRDAVHEKWFPFHTMRSVWPPVGKAPPEWASLWRRLTLEHALD